MVVDGVEVGGDESSPTEAVVGSSLLALRGDLAEFEGWQVDVHVDINATNADGEFQVTLQSGEAEGSGGEVQRTLLGAEVEAAREDARQARVEDTRLPIRARIADSAAGNKNL